MDRLSAYGIGIDVPPGWEAELSLQQDADLAVIDGNPSPPDGPLVVLHMANFWMPAQRSDYGSEALQAMGPDGVFIALVEFDRTAVGTLLFKRRGIPDDLDPDEFDRTRLQQPRHEQAGLQRFFSVGNRAFCLHAVIGAYHHREALAQEVNTILSGLSIE